MTRRSRLVIRKPATPGQREFAGAPRLNTRPGHPNFTALRPRRSNPRKRQDAYALPPVHRTFVRFRLERKRLTVDGIKPHLIGADALPIPLNVDVMHNLTR